MVWPVCAACGIERHQPYDDGLVECIGRLVEQRDSAQVDCAVHEETISDLRARLEAEVAALLAERDALRAALVRVYGCPCPKCQTCLAATHAALAGSEALRAAGEKT